MLIGVISDTHIKSNNQDLPENVKKAFNGVDLIIHAGDVVHLSVIDKLEKIAPTIAVQGNVDRAYDLELPASVIKDIEGLKVGIVHGEVYPKGDSLSLKYLAREMGVDVLISGHSHQAHIEKVDDILLLNPGSPIYPRLTDPTVMLLDISDGEVNADIIVLGPPVCDVLNFKK